MLVEILNNTHDLNSFDCGDSIYNNYLKNQAHEDLNNFFSKTYILRLKNSNKVIAFYSLISSQITESESRFMLNKATKLPAILLGKLAVDKDYKGKNIASDLCAKAFKNLLFLCEHIGYVAIIVEAATDELAENLYKPQGFQRLNNKPRRLYISTTELIMASKN